MVLIRAGKVVFGQGGLASAWFIGMALDDSTIHVVSMLARRRHDDAHVTVREDFPSEVN